MNKEFIKQVGHLKWFARTFIWQLNKRLFKKMMAITLFNGEKVHLQPHKNFAAEAYVTNGDLDWGTEKLFEKIVPAGGVFLDVGGHIGYYSALMNQKTDKIYCFEPDENNFEGLALNLKDRPKIEHVQKAVSEESSQKTFYVSPSGATSSLEKVEGYKEVKVDCISIDDFYADKPEKVTAIKTDIEGYDLQALFGAKKTIQKHQPVIITEQQVCDELFDFVEGLNYKLYGFARKLPDVTDHFKELKRGEDYYLKMIFLVPSELDLENLK